MEKQLTAIDFLLKEIVLKQVKGSVYLIPAITDMQIEEAKRIFKQQIISAWEDMGNNWDFKNGTDYFTQTFTTNQ